MRVGNVSAESAKPRLFPPKVNLLTPGKLNGLYFGVV